MLVELIRESDYFKQLNKVPDDDDISLHRKNCSPELVTKRLRELIPLLNFVKFRVVKISPQKTTVKIPLLEAAMNQNGTQQASIFYIIADYAIGIGIFGVLPGVYVTGIHDRCRAFPVQYWLIKNKVRHIAPGTGELQAEISISASNTEKLRNQLIRDGYGKLEETIQIFQKDRLVGEAQPTMGIYADIPLTINNKYNKFQIYNMKTSAVLISGLRDDPLSKEVSQEQGKALAARFSKATPQLSGLVKARTLEIERLLKKTKKTHSQVVVFGVGLDTKPTIYSDCGRHWFGIDLPALHEERRQRWPELNSLYFTEVSADIRSSEWDRHLMKAGFDKNLSTLFIAEGISMYLTKKEFQAFLVKLRNIAVSESIFWVDHITPLIFKLDIPEVKSFLTSMSRLGEPFVLGANDIEKFSKNKWKTEYKCSAADLIGSKEIIHKEYLFSTLQPSSLK